MNVIERFRNRLYVYVTGKTGKKAQQSHAMRSSESTLMVQVITIGFTFFSSFLISRTLGAGAYGIYVYFFSWLALFSVLANIGLHQLAVRQVSLFLSKSEALGLKSFMQWSMMRALVFSTLSGGLFYLMAPYLNINEPYLRVLGGLSILVLGLNTLFQGYLAGAHEVVQSQVPNNLFRPAAVISLLLFALYFRDSIQVSEAILFGCIGIFVSLLYYLCLVWKKFSGISLNPIGKSEKKLWRASSYYFFLLSLVSVINSRADVMLLGLLDTEAHVGIYNIAGRFTDFIPFTLIIANMVAAPLIAKYYEQKDKHRLSEFLPRLARFNFAFSSLVLLALLLFGNMVLGFFGEAFKEAYPVLVIIGLAQWFNVSTGSVGLLLSMSGHEKQALVIQSLSAVLNIILDFILIPPLGIIGAALATAISLFAWNLGMVFFARTKLGIKVTIFGKV